MFVWTTDFVLGLNQVHLIQNETSRKKGLLPAPNFKKFLFDSDHKAAEENKIKTSLFGVFFRVLACLFVEIGSHCVSQSTTAKNR